MVAIEITAHKIETRLNEHFTHLLLWLLMLLRDLDLVFSNKRNEIIENTQNK